MTNVRYLSAGLNGGPTERHRDMCRLRQWYDSLPRGGQEALYSLHEIKDATGISLTRLLPLLWRAGWSVERKPPFPGVRLWRGPISSEDRIEAT